MRFLGRMLVIFLAFAGIVGFLATGVGIWLASSFSSPSLPAKNVLMVDLDRPIDMSGPSLSFGKRERYDLYGLISAIEEAAADPRITALTATISSPSMSLATAQEIHEAITRFRTSGKPAVLFSESFGEGGNGTIAYYLATAFGEIWLQPSGVLTLNGFAVEAPFLKDFLEKVGVKGEFSGRYEYKSAIDVFTRADMSSAQKENIGRLLGSWTTQVMRSIAFSRKITVESAHLAMADSPLLAPEALRSGFVDSLGYREDAFKAVLAETDSLLDVMRYADDLSSRKKGETGVALIHAEGEIVAGESQRFPFQARKPMLGSHTVARALLDAGSDPEIQAIILYIDSPGGSYVASDTIHDAVARVISSGKPVIAVMGGSAASGGYFSVMGATKIIAQPGTVTGSIGVFSGKFSLAELWSKLGVNWDGIQYGETAGRWTLNRDFTPEEWKKLNATLDAIYGDFIHKAATDRRLSAEQIDHAARGRIWSGEDALELGLVDHLGGLTSARRVLKRELNLPETSTLDIRAFPPPKSRLQQLLELGEGGGFMSSSVEDRILLDFLKVLGPLLKTNTGPLMQSPEFEVR